ncbi:trypsin-like serine peptidase [Thermoactinospora rubra]|uniref:trypsin-like serine peptidase n=1 Tax=Thermoactinospora rubra TaxID=1088767 RepID=UPI000A106206|nr:hypothetical protein [Thermoactinospora rubra]
MKRILIPAGGTVMATGLLAAGLAGTAQAAPDVASDPLAKSAAVAKEIAEFWTESNGAALKAATASNVWDNGDVTRLKTAGGYTPDSKPGLIGAPKANKSVKVHNVNLPKTIGKVFFVNAKGEKKWCSATSIQSKYGNLVATAGHCVYDPAHNTDVMSKWVFVPGYYQGKTPWGIYVGKQAFTHYDFDVYEDYDRDYAFVTVYNGIKFSDATPKQVPFSEFKKFEGIKFDKQVEISEAEYTKCKLDPHTTDFCDVKPGTNDELAGPNHPEAVVDKVEVKKETYEAAKVGKGQGYKFGPPVTEHVTKDQYDKYEGPGEKKVDEAGNYTITHYYVQKWYKPGTKTKYYRTLFYIVDLKALDAGRLATNVGAQGFAWNQPTGKYHRVFGYPSLPHPDGNKPYTGVTPKWCYGKTSSKTVVAPAKKIEEHVALRCAMTEGADGGPWLYRYSNAKRLGYVNGVTSTFADQDGNNRIDTITSPYFDGETAAVYRAAANVWSGKIAG